MGHIEFLSENLARYGSVYYFDSELIRDIVEDPYVVIADDPGDLDSRIGKFGELAEEADKAAWNHIAVFEPVVEDVSEKTYLLCVLPNVFKKVHDPALRLF